MEDAAQENVKYIEIRFAPQKHLQEGLTLNEVILCVLEGIHKAEKSYDIKGNLILFYLRHTDEADMVAVIDASYASETTKEWLRLFI